MDRTSGAPSVDPLASPQRRVLMEVIEACPGLSVRALQARLCFQWSSFYLHLRRLEAAGLVRVETDRLDARVRRIFPAGSVAAPPARPLILRGVALDLARLVAERPGMDFAELVRMIGEPPRSVHHHLKRLCDAGLVASGSVTRYRDLRATGSLEDLLRNIRPTSGETSSARANSG